MRLTIPPALVWRKSVLVNGRLVMELMSNLALSSSASATSGNDIDGMRTDDESARSDGCCVYHRVQSLLSPLQTPRCAASCQFRGPRPPAGWEPDTRLNDLTNDQGCYVFHLPGAHESICGTLSTSPTHPHCPAAVHFRAQLPRRQDTSLKG